MPIDREELPKPAGFASWKEALMRFVSKKRILGASIVVAAGSGLLLANVLPSSVSAPRASVLAVEATVSPFAMMMKAPRDLPVEQYDAH
jgi:hypothetical protein